ncbi:hypothetical protein E2I00_009096 [Balaenoptera physalus]|uniref:Translation initiation factor eIF2 assembly protein n=1 Tax=Balaenoptera physalus TaxID=9770 RepID=A0A6A1QIX3_BALPH|nr:hypothetical protein E2I00_009096 [Balaenoptera physalus]
MTGLQGKQRINCFILHPVIRGNALPFLNYDCLKPIQLKHAQNVKDYLLDDGTLVVSGREDPPTCSQPDSDNEAEEIQWSDDENTATLTPFGETSKNLFLQMERLLALKYKCYLIIDFIYLSSEILIAPEFPEFTTKVQEAINSLGGSVFPKLNWSAPRDAYWIAMNSSLKCKTLSDIFLLFKSSDFITRDFTQPFIHCTDDSPDPCMEYELVLRKWCELIPGAEFRCFVKENKLIVVFDIYRDSRILQLLHVSALPLDTKVQTLSDWVRGVLSLRLEPITLAIATVRGKVWLIDFNPFGEVTDALLFTWDELLSGRNLKGDFSEEALEQDAPAFRCTNSEVTVQPSPYLSYRLPKDFVDLSTGEDAHKLIDFLKLKRNQQEDD